MSNRKYDFNSNGINIIENYVDVDTNKAYNLLVYQCTINNIDRSFVIGSIIDNNINIDKINKYIDKIISFRFLNMGSCFILGAIHYAKKIGIFNNIKLSNETYNLFMQFKPYEYFEEKLIHQAKETTIDKTTKRFSITHNTNEPFNPILYYEKLEEGVKENHSANAKTLKKVI